MIRAAVIGVGLIGRERLQALFSLKAEGQQIAIAGIYDSNQELCRSTALEFGTSVFGSVESLLQEDLDWVMIALPHDSAVQVALAALQSGASVLMEKPMGRDLNEAKKLVQCGGERLHVGFNYRFYEGISHAVRDIRRGRFGTVVSIEFVLGHGCAPGQQETWKLNELSAGGGCLIDPGVHLLDLSDRAGPERRQTRRREQLARILEHRDRGRGVSASRRTNSQSICVSPWLRGGAHSLCG